MVGSSSCRSLRRSSSSLSAARGKRGEDKAGRAIKRLETLGGTAPTWTVSLSGSGAAPGELLETGVCNSLCRSDEDEHHETFKCGENRVAATRQSLGRVSAESSAESSASPIFGPS